MVVDCVDSVDCVSVMFSDGYSSRLKICCESMLVSCVVEERLTFLEFVEVVLDLFDLDGDSVFLLYFRFVGRFEEPSFSMSVVIGAITPIETRTSLDL